MALQRVRSWFAKASARPSGVAGEVPKDFGAYIESVQYREDGASLLLTRDGLDFGRGSFDGAVRLSRAVMEQPAWRGDRSVEDVAREVRAHCRAWSWLPPLRSRANPVDLEYYDAWPGNLLVSFHLKRPGRQEP